MKTGVILAAGKSQSFEVPTCLLEFEGHSLIKRTIAQLQNNDISNIIVIVGYKSKKVMDHLNGWSVTFVENKDYLISGTMKSLAASAAYVKDDFILVEGDLIYEENVIEQLLASNKENSIVCTGLSGSGDEAFVEYDDKQNLYKISKDIRQMNRLSAEMVGISKISYNLFQTMLSLYDYNENILLNYEYLIERAAHEVFTECLVLDGLVWSDIDDKKSYEIIKNKIFPQIKSRESDYKLDYAKTKLCEVLGISNDSITSFGFAGGMTNSNFRAVVDEKELFIRIPGKCTEVLISRENEALNSKLASSLGINAETIYCNVETGIKVTKAIPSAETLTPRAGRLPLNIKEVSSITKNLHTSDLPIKNIFSGIEELNKYEELCKALNVDYYQNYSTTKEKLMAVYKKIENEIGIELKPCHNDLVPENFVRSGKAKLYLLDWEYSGLNDPAWDLAAYINECHLTRDEISLFLNTYYENNVTIENYKKILMYRIFQDVLWSVWTLAKEANGDDFGTYGQERFDRANSLLEEFGEC